MKCIEKNGKKYYDVVIIFERLKDVAGMPTYFKPISIRPGNYNKDNRVFTDVDGIDYMHMSEVSSGKIGFGLRTSLQETCEIYNKKTLKSNARAFYNEVRFDTFYFGTSNNDYSRVYLVGENKITRMQAFYDDRDLVVMNFVHDVINTKELINNVKKKVIGQNDAIDDIVTTLWQNFHSDNKKNMLLVGPTGVGKTEIIKTIAKELNVPLVIASASALTKAGYKGDSVENILRRLLNKVNGDVNRLNNSIIVLDEFDKLASHDLSNDTISTSGVQEELLKCVEGCEYELDVSDNPMVEEFVTINTEGITFICLGAFADLDRQNKSKKSNSIGFGSKVEAKKDDMAFYGDVTSDDLIKYGIIPELAGRLPMIISLNPINEDILLQIMDNPDSGIFDEKFKLLKEAKIKLTIVNPDEVKKKIAHVALQKNTGVRGLTSVIERTFVKAMKDVSQSDGEYSELIIDVNTVDDPKKYVLKKRV